MKLLELRRLLKIPTRRFKLGFRALLPALMAISIFGGPVLSVVEGTARADLYLNDPYPLPGGDQTVSLSDALFIQQSLDGTGCELKPVVDTDGNGVINAEDVSFSIQNYGCNSSPCNLPGPTTGTPIEILPDPNSPNYGLPSQTLVLTATVSNTISPSTGAQINCINNAIVVDLDPFIEDDGIPVIFEIAEDTGGGAYLGTTPGATTLLTWVNSTDPFDLSTGIAHVDLTLGNSGTVRVVARTRLLTNPPVWDNVLQTFQAEFPQIIVGALDIHITSPANGTFLSTTVTDVTVTTTTAVGSTIYLKIDGVTHSEISHVVADVDWDPVKGWYEFTIPNVDLWIDTSGDRWVPLIAVIQATGGMSNIVDVYPDTTSPSVNITQPAPAETITTNLVTVIASCSDGGSGIASCRVWVDGKAEQDSPGVFILADGPHTAYARATDNVGNTILSTPVPFNVFTGIIWVTITSPTDGTIFATQDIPISGTYLNVGADPTITANGTTMTDDGTTPNGNWSGVVDTGAEGSVTITVTADDTFNIATASVNICVDTLDPTVSIVPLPCQASNTVVVTGTVDGTGTCGLVSVVVNPGTVIADVVGSNWTAIMTLPDGMGQAIDVTATDAAGNTTVTSTTMDVDTQAPVVTITSPTDGEITNSTIVVVNGTATDGSGSGVVVVLINGQTAAGTEDWSITFTGQTGYPSYSAVAVDSCGNQSSPQLVSITIDLDLPTAELISPPNGSCWSSSAVRADAVCNDVGSQISSCQVRIDGGLWQDVPVTISGLSDGFHIAVARAIDQGGNESLPDFHNFIVDTTAPIVSISSPTPDSWSGGTVVITGTVSDAVRIGNSAMLCLGTTGDECVIYRLSPLATPTYSESGSLDADFGDVDGDEVLDIVVANHNGQNRLYINDGNGIFTDGTTRMPLDSDLSYDVELVDVNGDLAQDIFVSNYGQNRLYLNNGSGFFTDETASRLPADSDQSRDAEFGDVDGDEDLDIIIANYNGQNRLYLNDGFGFFSDATEWLPEDNDGSFDIEVGNVDLDSDLDIFVSNWAEQNRLYLNNGSGIFSDATDHLPEDTDYSRDADLIDVNGDYYPDLVIANYFGQNRLYLNDGNWGRGEPASFFDFTSTNLPALVDNSIDIALADIDWDGDPDLVVANYHQQNRLYLNDGNGVFSDITDPHLPADLNRSRDADFGDVDGDGDPDIIIANYLEQNLLYINNYGTVVQTVPVNPATGDFTGAFFNVSQGSYTATVISWDNCGNSSSASVSFNVDTTDPLVDISSPFPGECIISSAVVVDGSVTEISPYTILVTVSNATYTYTNSGAFFPITVSGVTDGVYDIDAVVTDAGGNVGSAPTVANVEVDTVEPLVTINLPIAGECIGSSTVCVDASSDGGENVTCTLDGENLITAPGCWFGIMDNPHTIECSSTDDCGNDSVPVSVTITVDTQIPVTVASPSGGSYSSTQTVTLTSTDNLDPSPDIYYSENLGPFLLYTAPLTISVTTTLDFYAVDDCGNVEPVNQEVYIITAEPPPVVTFVSPSSAPAGAPISIYGENFQLGAETHPNTGFYDPIYFMFEPLSGGIWIDSTQIEGSGPSSIFPPGTVLDVYVTNPDEQTGICYGCFTVSSGAEFAMSIESPIDGALAVTVNGITYGSVIASIPFNLIWVNGTSPYDTSSLTVLANGLTTFPGSLLSVTSPTGASGRIQVACNDLAGSFGTIANVTITAYGVYDAVGPAAPDSVTVTVQLGEIGVEDVTVYEAIDTFIVPVNVYYDSIFGDAFDRYDIWVYYDPGVINVDCAAATPVVGSDSTSPFYAPQFGDPTVFTCDNFLGEVHFSYDQGASPIDPTGFFNVANINMIRVGAVGSSTDLTVSLLDFCNSSGDCYSLGSTLPGYPWPTFPTYIKSGRVDIIPPLPETEPNDDPSSCNRVWVDSVVSGEVNPSGDWDYFCFTISAGQTIGFDIDADEIGSPLDSWLELYDDTWTLLADNDDAFDPDTGFYGPDSYLSYTFATGGTYYIAVTSCCPGGGGGPGYWYNLLIRESGGFCGDMICDPWENVFTCPDDCSGFCGNWVCEPEEDEISCPEDCSNIDCGDAYCQPWENEFTCPDCFSGDCWDMICDPWENWFTCPDDCSGFCGNWVCEPGEDEISCDFDCFNGDCGNGFCELWENEFTCPDDCDWCGNGYCGPYEDPVTCPADCF